MDFDALSDPIGGKRDDLVVLSEALDNLDGFAVVEANPDLFKNAVFLTLTANLATAYSQIRLANEQIVILQKVLKTREEAFATNQDRYEGEITFYGDKRAVSLFFPSLTLTAVLGLFKLVQQIFDARDKPLPNLFDAGRLRSNLKLEIALANLKSYAEEYETLEKATEWAETSYKLYKDRYLAGLTYYIDVVNTERDFLNYQLGLSSVQAFRFISTIQLIQALGGSWSCQGFHYVE